MIALRKDSMLQNTESVKIFIIMICFDKFLFVCISVFISGGKIADGVVGASQWLRDNLRFRDNLRACLLIQSSRIPTRLYL